MVTRPLQRRWVFRPANIVIAQQTNILNLARAMASPCNAVAGIDLTGRLFVTRVALGSPRLRLDAQGREWPPVLGAARQNTSPPYKRIVMGAAQSWRVHSFDEVSYYADLIERGLYDPDATYREGHIVGTLNKARWLYINPAPASGNAPPTWPTTSNDYWQNFEPPASATNLTYADGTPIEDLRPSEGGADVTASNLITFKPVTPVQVQADATGATTTSLPVARLIALQRGATVLDAGVAFAVVSANAGIEASIGSSSGLLSVTSANASGQVIVSATFAGRTYETSVSVDRSLAGPAVGGGSGASQFIDTVLTNVSSSTEAKVTDNGVLVRSDSNGELKFNLNASYLGNGRIAATPKYSADNASWTAVGPEVLGSEAFSPSEDDGPPSTFYSPGEYGFLSFELVATGLTPDTDYYVALFARRGEGSGTLSWQSATFSVSQIA